jgi:hypothetical protein
VLRRALAVASAERHRDANELLAALEATVSAASLSRPSNPGDTGDSASPRLGARSADTVEIAPTQPDPLASPGDRSLVTTNGATSRAQPRRSTGLGARTPRRVAGTGLGLVLAVVAGLGWRAATVRRTTSPAVGVTGQSVATPPTLPTSASAPTSSLPTPSASTPGSIPPSSQSMPPLGSTSGTSSPRHAPPRGPSRAVRAAPSDSVATPPQSGKIIVQ